ncbi:MAG: DUF4252 domain-containing protein [Marinilabiliaceae bacterium]|jgi:hypothetical protein|nr:DUF4252 domain-containing protein [Marinilabiliaceae bacterium]
MKRLLLIASIIAVGLSSFGQSNPIDDFFEKYSGREGFTTIYISSRMFSLIAQADLDDDELQETMNNLKSIRILTVEDSVLNRKHNFYKELTKTLDLSDYEELMVVQDGGQDLKFLIREKGRRIEELLMIGGGGEGGNILLSIKGDLDLENISNISKNIGIEQLEGIDNAKNKKKYD